MKAHHCALALTLPVLASGCFSTSKDRSPEPVAVQSADSADFSGYATIAQTVGGTAEFSAFSRILAATGFADALAGDGAYTVFVVRDDTASQLVAGGLAADAVELDGLAAYHVVEGRYSLGNLMDVSSLETVGGQRLVFSHWNGSVEVGGFANDAFGFSQARVVLGDQQCSNGVVHVIDQVLFPTFDTLADQVEETGSFTTLVQAARHAGVFDLLDQAGPFTVFAPTDDAFGTFGADSVAWFMAEENRADLVRLLQHHVVAGRYYGDNMHHQTLTTLAGTEFDVEWQSGAAYIGSAQVVVSDFEATNGVLHVVDTVLMPR